MTINEDVADLIAQLEGIVGQYYHNEQERGGFFFRYPVRFTRDDTNYECKGKGKIPNLSPDEVFSVHYKTGANSLYIGRAIYAMLQFLENRYKGKVDFAKFEEGYRIQKKTKMISPFEELDKLFDEFYGARELEDDFYKEDEEE